MASNIDVKITAEVIDLKTKFAVAKAESQALTRELNALARQAAQGTGGPELKASLTQAAESAVKAQGSVKALNAELRGATGGSNLFAGAMNYLKAAIAPVIAAVSAGAILHFGEELVSSAANIEHEAQVLGLSSVALQDFSESAKLAGVDVETVDTALKRFNVSQGAALEGSKEQAEAFKKLGVSAALPGQDAIPQLARALLDYKDKQEQAKLGAILFGKQFEELRPLLTQWAQGTDALNAKLTQMGVILDPGTTKAAHESEIALTTVGDQMKVAVTPAVVGLANALTGVVQWGEKFDAWIARTIPPLEAMLNPLGAAVRLFNAWSGAKPPELPKPDPASKAAIDDWNKVLEKLDAPKKKRSGTDETIRDAIETARIAQESGLRGLQNDAELDKLKLANAKAALEQEVEAGTITNAEKLAQTRKLVEQEDLLDVQRLENEIKYGNLTIAEHDHVTGEILKAWVKLSGDLAAIDREMAADAQKTAREQAKEQFDLTKEMESAEQSFVRDVFAGRQRLGSILLGVASRIAQDWIAFEFKQLAQHLLVETQMTAATAAGEQARVAVKATARAEGAAIDISAGQAQIMNDAMKAAAGAYSAVVGIPYVGPILAPIAAAVAFTAVEAFDNLTSFDVGTPYVPRNMIAQVHEGEAIIPKAYNPAAGGRATGLGGGDIHLHMNPTYHAPTDFKNMARTSGRQILEFIQSAIRDGSLKIQPA